MKSLACVKGGLLEEFVACVKSGLREELGLCEEWPA